MIEEISHVRNDLSLYTQVMWNYSLTIPSGIFFFIINTLRQFSNVILTYEQGAKDKLHKVWVIIKEEHIFSNK